MDENDVEIKECFDYLYLHKRDMSGGQIQLIDSFKRQWQRKKELSEMQTKILLDLKRYLIQDIQ